MRAFFLFSHKHFCFHSYSAIAVILLGPVFSTLATAEEEARSAEQAPRPLIVENIDESRLTVLKGNTHPLARAEFDLGTAPATLPMERMLLVLKRSPEQESALAKLLDDQQDKNSPNYHKWLTPEEFGKQFGPTDGDMQTIIFWLQSHGFQVGATKGRTTLEFSGSASQVQEAFHTTIHKYIVNGEQHWANASDPSIPSALTPAVAGVLTLHNFIKKPTIHFTGERIPAKIVLGKKPQVTFPAQNGQPAINALSPADYAVIYNINPVYDKGITGQNIRLGVVARSDLFKEGQDISDFFVTFLQSAGFVNVVINGADPGDLGGGEEAEVTLDTTWAGAIAPGSTVDVVVSATTNTTDGVDLSENYIIENNFADVMTESFSACELYATDAQLAGATEMAVQAAVEGITYVVSAGDNGAEGCDDPSVAPATHSISVNYLASTAFNVAVGGTMFNEHGNTSKYWTSASPFAETAISYIPEDAWNESGATKGLWAGGGGASAGNYQSGVGTTRGVPKPSWQSGVAGIPDDNVRDVPDVSLTAAQHDPYLLCLEGSCEVNSQGEIGVYFVGGTSAAAPSFAGIMRLLDEGTTGHRSGLANYVLYRLAATQSSYPSQCDGSNTSGPPASTCIFNDVVVGNNAVPGEQGSNYQASTGYDLTTGLGSVNVSNLYDQWNIVTFNPTTTTLTLNATEPLVITHGQPVSLQATVSPSSSAGTPTGDLTLYAFPQSLAGNTSIPSVTFGLLTLTGGQASSSMYDVPALSPNSANSVWAHYGGDSTYAPSDSNTVQVTVNPEPSATSISVLTANKGGQSVPFISGPFGSFIYLRADVSGQSGYGVPSGSVTFTDSFGTIPGGSTFALNSQGNTANPNGVFNFDTGTHTISASYNGDYNFSPSSTTKSQTFTITPGFYATISTTAKSTVLISAPGGSGATSVSLSTSTGFSGSISLACSGLPSEAACTFSVAPIKASGKLATTSSAVTVSTKAPTSAVALRTPLLFAESMLGTGLLFAMVVCCGTKKNRSSCTLSILLATLLVASCGGGGSSSSPPPPPPDPGTPTGTYNVVVTATSGSVFSSTGFVLVVQ